MSLSHDSSLTLMNQAIDQARKTMNADVGGPFGALIVDEDGTVVAVASNSVLQDHDPTAHAEINAIRQAAKRLKTHDLSKCTLYTTAYPCPMCMGAILWANIKKIVYGCRPADADAIGFRDDFMYDFMKSGCRQESLLAVTEKHREECLRLFSEYHEKNKRLY